MIYLLWCLLYGSMLIADTITEYAVPHAQQEIMTIGLVVNAGSARLQSIAHSVKQQIEITGQFKMRLLPPMAVTALALRELQGEAIGLVVVIEPNENTIVWRLFDTVKKAQVQGMALPDKGAEWQVAAMIADQLWPHLANKPGFFNSVVAACKLEKSGGGLRAHRTIGVFMPGLGWQQQSPKRVLVSTRTDNFAPRWHPTKLTLYYSRQTPRNIEMCAVNTCGFSRVVASFSGQNLTATVSPCGRIVLSLSTKTGSQLYEYRYDESTHKAIFEQITAQGGYFVSPSFQDDRYLVCNHIATTTASRIAVVDTASRTLKVLPVGQGYAPSVYGSKVAYCKKIKGFLQLFVYDLELQKDRQVTFSASDKDEPCWMVQGGYIVCSAEKKGKSSIVMIDCDSGREWGLTPEQEHWSFPHCAGAAHTSFLTEGQLSN